MLKPIRALPLVLICLGADVALAQVAGAIVVYPADSSIELGSSRQFSAYVPISPNTITWSVNDVAGGNATVGAITAKGLYKPPAVAPMLNTVTVKATSKPYPKSYGAASLKITRKNPNLWSVYPNPIQVGNYEVSFNGSNFAQDSQALANGMPVTTRFVSATKLVVKGTAAQAGSIQFAVRQPDPGTITGNSVSVQVNATPAPVSVSVSPSAASVELSKTQVFTASVTGNSNTAVTWSVNGVAGGSAATGVISNAGLFAAPAAMPGSPVVVIRATSVASPSSFAQASVTLTAPPQTPDDPPVDPNPNPSALLSAGRFLEQSSFGPTPATLAKVQQMGITPYLDDQLAASETFIPSVSGNSMGGLRQWVLYNYSTANDQLRQRVAYSLGQIVVTSGAKLNYADEILPWLRLLSKYAFGNYREFLKEVTMSPSMGKYLDLANSIRPGAGGGANENYPREFIQLFTIGLYKLNMDGSQQLLNGQPVRVYDETTVRQVALALTGWTYATAPGATPRATNWEYFGGPMETREQNHDVTAKSFLGCSLPPGQTVMQDLDASMDCIFQHPNVPPFIATRLIRSLVTSNPSPAYIQRIAEVFANNGAGVRGDLKAVVRAILLDPEARQDTATVNQGRLKEPILQVVGFVRALNGQFSSSHQVTYVFDNMAQPVLAPPSVFNWFSPLYRIPKSSLFGPEFQIYTPTEATLRGNFIYQILGQNSDTPIDLAPFQPYGNDMPGLVEAVDRALLYGRMTPAMKQALINAATPGYDAKTRIETVLYLTAISGQYAVQH